MKAYVKKFPFLFIGIFLLAILLRIVLFNWVLQFWNNGDFTRYEDWARIAHVYNLADTYTTRHLSVSTSYPNNQPPGSLYILSGTYETYILVGKAVARLTHTAPGSILWINTFFQHIMIRIPFILADLGMGMLAYLLVVREEGKKKALIAMSLILFNPVIWYNSTIWGQMDSLNNFFFLLSLILAYRKNFFLSIFAFFFSLYIKLSLLPLLPFYLIFLYFFSNKNLSKILIALCVSIAGLLIATIPISNSPITWLINELPIIAHGELQNITNSAFNFWWLVTCPPLSCTYPPVENIRFAFITLGSLGYILFAATTIPILFLQIKKTSLCIRKDHLFLLLSIVTLAVFLFLPKMHDRYLYPFFPLFAIAVVFSKRIRIFAFLYIIFSIIHTLNLMYSWYPTYFPFFFFYQIFYSKIFDWCMSLLLVATGSFFYIVSLKELRRK